MAVDFRVKNSPPWSISYRQFANNHYKLYHYGRVHSKCFTNANLASAVINVRYYTVKRTLRVVSVFHFTLVNSLNSFPSRNHNKTQTVYREQALYADNRRVILQWCLSLQNRCSRSEIVTTKADVERLQRAQCFNQSMASEVWPTHL